MTEKWTAINLMRHYRHDWLNHLQLINGYLAMGRVEKVEVLINEIVVQAQNESHLSNLNMDQLAEEILTFNWQGYSFLLNFEVVSEVVDWSKWEQSILMYFQDMMQLLDNHTKRGEDQHATLLINDVDKKTIEIDFEGTLRIDDRWCENISRIEQQYGNHIEQIEWNESECYVKYVVEI
ncbi:Spo0B domain-containing protein [Salipaludibacillus sp. HK11]|uniref:Spo0B domain-containing protein n=1 Tax=Salipaludibacillus sp. HK11 TaxID=3394320 RepID=UPI0039FCAF85